MVKKLLALTLLLVAAWASKAQLPPPCPANDSPPADFCSDICIYCNFNGYMGTSTGYTGQTPPGFCGTIENEQWLGFIAGAPAATFTATPTNCTNGNGVQIALYTSCSSSPVACNGGAAGGAGIPVSITTSLTPGVNYYLLIDGYAGDLCDFSINVVPPSAVQAPNVGPTGLIQGPTTICPGATVTFSVPVVSGAGAYTWDAPPGSLINGQSPPVSVAAPGGNVVQVTIGPNGGQICVTPENSCNEGNTVCKNIIVQPIPPTILPPVVVCNEDVPYELPWGDLVSFSGTYETTFTSYQGCDSVVRKQVIVKPPIIRTLPPQTICAGTCVTICGEEYCDGGTYAHICESYQGCDSLINFSLLVLDPVAEIIGPFVLSCAQDTITLTSTLSPGTKVWKRLNGTILGTGNSLIVTQPGTVILTVTASAGGNFCIRNDTVMVTGNTTPPTISATGGVIGCGNAQAQISTTTNAQDSSFLWSPAVGLSSTTIGNPVASQQGTYTVVVTDGVTGCTNSATVTITGNTTPPSASANGGTLTCSATALNVTASTNVPAATYAWAGPNGFSSNVQNPSVTEPGTYTVTITSSANSCTATATTTVNLNDTPPNATANGATISCATPNVSLAGGSPTNGVTYTWVGPGGYNSSAQNPIVGTAGTYTVTVLNPANGCTSTATALVDGDTIAPNASANGGIISCAEPDLNLTGNSTTQNVTYTWTGPNSFSSMEQNPSVNVAGLYTLVVTSANACTQSVTATVDGDFTPPDVAATGGVISCSSSSTTINGTSNTPGVTYEWVGPSGGIFTGPNPTVSNTGDYTLTVTAPNGCTASTMATVMPDVGVPNASASGGTLDCNISSISLDGGSTTPGVILSWTGPNGFNSTLEDPTVTDPGVYTLTVSDPSNGCTAIATADVLLDDVEPDASAVGGTVTCAMPNLDLAGASPSNNVTWAWTGPNSFSSNLQNPNTADPGTYTLTVTGENGCTSTASATVEADQTLPVPSSTTGTLTCALTDLTLNGNADVPVSYLWSGPNNFSSSDQNPSVSIPGAYTLVVTSTGNGCVDSLTVMVDQDIVAPDISATGNTISCTNPQVQINGSSATAGATLAWTGPNNFSSGLPDPSVGDNGTYTLTVTGLNGCTSVESVEVLLDTESPTINTQVPDVLTCSIISTNIQSTATNSTSPVLSYAWSGPAGFTSTDEDPAVIAPGDYTVVVTSENGCTTTAVATVNQDIAPPDISAQGGTLTCLITDINLDGGSATPNATFAWQGPGFNSTLEDPTITVAGDYTLTVTGPNGCTSTALATVVLDGDFPDAQAASSNDLDCDDLTTELTGTSNTPDVQYSWLDPNNAVIGSTPVVTTSAPGTYLLNITAPNGCVTTVTVDVAQDIVVPGATAQGDTVDCISGQTPILGGSQTATVSWNWAGPNGFSSTQQNPIVSQAGTYILTVTGQNACTSTATAVVEENTDSPVVSVAGAGTLTCVVTELTLSGAITTPGATGVWTDASGAVISTTGNVDVSNPGVYTYTVTAQNGCISAPTLTVNQNVVTPQNVTVTGGLINCTMPTLPLAATTSTPMVTYSWVGPGGFSSAQQNPVIDTAGTYTVLITNQANGCQATAVTNVTGDFVSPDINVTTETITCSLPTVTLESTTATPNVQYNWAGPDINASNQTVADPQITVAGTYMVTVTAQNGCTTLFSIEVDDDVTPPDVATTGTTLTCAQPSNTITGTSQTPGVTYSWMGPDGSVVSTTPNPVVSQVGNYTLVVTAPNGCTSSSIANVVPDASLPTVSATGGTISCIITDLQLTGTSNNANVVWQWSGPGGYTSTDQNPNITIPGNYNVTVTAPNGCTASTGVTVLADTDGPVIQTGVPNQLNCTTTQVSLMAGVQGPGNYIYSWTAGTNGNIISGQFSQSPVVSSAANYSVVVTNQQNGCTSEAIVPVVVDSTTVSGAALNVRDVSCFGKTDGVIGVANVLGGTPPFLYSIDDLPYVSASFFTSLDPGTHSLVIQDANGCEWETSIDIGEPEELLVDLGPDVIVPLGHTIQLSLDNTVNYPDRVETYILDPSSLDTAFCPTCVLRPLNSFRYIMTVVDSNGCKATDSRTIIVDKTRYVYIPNIFNTESADNDAIFYISGDTRQVTNIKTFRVFDRWGNAVFERTNFQPNDPQNGWDGTVRGDRANPAVFVYYAEIEFVDGETILYKGDVTLIRN